MTPCVNCGRPLVCACARTQSAGHVIARCNSTKAAIWALAITESGKCVGDVRISTDGVAPGVPTDSNGVVRFDGLTDGATYPVTLARLEPPHSALYDLVGPVTKSVVARQATITQVLFVLPEKATLRVELKPIGFVDLPGAKVVLSRVVSRKYQDGKTTVELEEVAKLAHAGGVVDFGARPARSYRITVEVEKPDDARYGAGVIDFELAPKEDKVVEVELHRWFSQVRFVGLCLATVGRQVWAGDGAMAKDYVTECMSGQVVAPDPTSVADFAEHLSDYWGLKKQTHWKARYNGPKLDVDDIKARVGYLRSAIEMAATKVSSDDTELKVFVAPECYFLGRYGAYPHEVFGDLIKALQDLVEDPKWRAWVFVFGTVNGFYKLDGDVTHMFNISPVIRGGWSGKDANKHTRLLQKSFFSAEIIASADLIPAPDLDRPQIVEETVGASFHTTQNDEIVVKRVREIAADIGVGAIQDKTKINDWIIGRWEKVKEFAERELANRTEPAFVADLRATPPEDGRRAPNVPDNAKADLRYLLGKYLEPGTAERIARPRDDTFNFRDFTFSCVRIPGPWLDETAVGEPKDTRHTRLTFAVEICADHNNGRVITSMASVAAHERPDIHVVPSAGMVLNEARVCVVDQGFAFNCDGWNAPGFAVSLSKRAGHIVFELDERIPRKSGANPLTPHTELTQRNGGDLVFFKGAIDKTDVGEDCSDIFGYRTPDERQRYADDMADLREGISAGFEVGLQGALTEATKALASREQLLSDHDLKITAKQEEIRLKQEEIVQAMQPPPSSGPNASGGVPPSVPDTSALEARKKKLQQELGVLERNRKNLVKTRDEAAEHERAVHEALDNVASRPKPVGPNPPEPMHGGQLHVYPPQELPKTYA